MIVLYRMIGFGLILVSTASLVSLTAYLNEELRLAAFILALLTAISQGAAGMAVYYQRDRLGDSFIPYFCLILASTLALIVGGWIQWVS